MIRVELRNHTLARCTSDAEAQFVVRLALKAAGIPIGPWGTSMVERGVLWWWDEWDRRIVEWKETEPAIAKAEGEPK